jgi:hypothetical protein
VTRWLVDGNNVMGSRPDGWWRDRPAAMQRLVRPSTTWPETGDEVAVVFDGRERDLQAAARTSRSRPTPTTRSPPAPSPA